MENNSLINNQNILLDYLDQPMIITFSTPSPLKSLVTKLHTRFTANNPHIKNSRLYNTKIWPDCSGLFEAPNFDGSYSGNKKM